MKTTSLNGTLLEQMLRNGLNNLKKHENQVNDMNVFPVSDGDTGTNMRLTLENGLASALSDDDLGAYLKRVNSGMLLGARGNSGVILSQLFNGMSQSLESDSIVNVDELMEALSRGYKVAYESVVKPVEGTILTVTRDGAEGIRSQINRSVSFESMLSMYIAEMKKSLALTPELLPVLKEAGVVDSGATGYIYIIEGMLKYLSGEIVSLNSNDEELSDSQLLVNSINPDLFNEDSVFTLGYCTEFLLQIMNSKCSVRKFDLDDFIFQLNKMGNSLVAVRDGSRVRVHIHTIRPYQVIEFAQQFGEFVTFKMENMQLQHNEHFEKKAELQPEKKVGIIAVANGQGIKDLFKQFGCHMVLKGGQTMNTSTKEFVDAFKTVNAEKIVVLPNNKNIIKAAQQAAALSGLNNVTVLETKSVVEGYYALAMAVGIDDQDGDYVVSLLKQGAENCDTVEITVASRDYTSNSIHCNKDDFVALVNGDLTCSGRTIEEIVTQSFSKVPCIDEKESCIVFKGADCTAAMEEEFSNVVEKNYPDMEVNFVEGGQGIYNFIIGF